MAKKALVLITNSFPFGKGETFVDNEIRYYSKFYPVYVVSIDNVCPQRFLNIPNNIIYTIIGGKRKSQSDFYVYL